MTVYLDVLLLTNLWADHAMLYAVSRLTQTPMKGIRGLIGAGVGGLSSLLILVPAMPLWLTLLLRLLTAWLMERCTFRFSGLRGSLERTGLLVVISVFFCGAVLALCTLRRPAGLCVRNTYVYADVSLLTLLFCITAASAVSSLLTRRAQRAAAVHCQLHLRIDGRDISLPALADTGDLLQDAYTGRPVAVCSAAMLRAWLSGFPDVQSACAARRGFRLLPVKTVTGTELLPAFQPDQAAVSVRPEEIGHPADILVAVSQADLAEAIVPACCVTTQKGGRAYGIAARLDRHAPALAAKNRQ